MIEAGNLAPRGGARGASVPAAPLATALATAGSVVPMAMLAALPGLLVLAGFDHLAYALGLLAGVALAGVLIAPHVHATGERGLAGAVRARFGPVAARVAAALAIAAAMPLLVAEMSVVASLADAALGMPRPWALGAAGALVAASALALQGRGRAALSALAYLLLVAAALVPLGLLAAKHAVAVPHFTFGQALDEIRALEERMIEAGAVDFATFAGHTATFVRLMPRDVVALVVSLALGMAVLPPLVSALAAGPGRAVNRLAGAWTALLVLIPLVSAPPLAAYVKLDIYRAMANPTPLADLPPWLEAPLRSEFARVHGTSLHLLAAVEGAVRAGAGDVEAVAPHVSGTSRAQWTALGRDVQEALLGAARTVADGPAGAPAWDLYSSAVWPVAARSATGDIGGETQPGLSQAALAIEPMGVLLALPGLTGFPREVALLLAAAVLMGAVLTAAGLARAATAAGEPKEAAGAPWRGAGVVAVAAALAAAVPIDPVTLVVAGLAIGGAALFPVLAIGLVWRRATAAGAIAAMVVGGGVALYYMGATTLAPRHFYATWPSLSDAGEDGRASFAMLAAERDAADTAEARAAAEAALDELVHGTATRAGLANWAGIDSTSPAIFSAPAGVLALVAVSLATARRRRATRPQP